MSDSRKLGQPNKSWGVKQNKQTNKKAFHQKPFLKYRWSLGCRFFVRNLNTCHFTFERQGKQFPLVHMAMPLCGAAHNDRENMEQPIPFQRRRSQPSPAAATPWWPRCSPSCCFKHLEFCGKHWSESLYLISNAGSKVWARKEQILVQKFSCEKSGGSGRINCWGWF